MNIRILTMLVTLLTCTPLAFSQTKNVTLERDGLIYTVGSVERVFEKVALIDLGAVHLLKLDDQLVVFRHENRFYKPIGVVRVAEIDDAHSRTERLRTLDLKPGDVVMRIHEFTTLRPARQYRSKFLREHAVRKSGGTGYSTIDNIDTAAKLAEYDRKYPNWEKANGDNLGYLNGASWGAKQERFIDPIVGQIDQLRKHYSEGHKTLSSLGPEWVKAMQILSGPIATERHKATQVQVDEDDFPEETEGVSPLLVDRMVRKELFDRDPEEKKFAAYITRTGYKAAPRRIDLWVSLQITRSQFASSLGEDSIVQKITKMIRELRQ